MRVLVCGGREFDDYSLMAKTLESLVRPNTMIIQGGAKGADALAKLWAKASNILSVEYPANWNKYGKRAGYLRNKQMLDEGKPDLVVAFPGGKGTANMVKLAEEAGVKVIRIDSESKALSS